MINMEFKEAVSETLDILEDMDEKYIQKIPKKIISFLKENKLHNYNSRLDHTKKLYEMQLKEKTKDILAIICIKYWYSNEEKTQYLNMIKNN